MLSVLLLSSLMHELCNKLVNEVACDAESCTVAFLSVLEYDNLLYHNNSSSSSTKETLICIRHKQDVIMALYSRTHKCNPFAC